MTSPYLPLHHPYALSSSLPTLPPSRTSGTESAAHLTADLARNTESSSPVPHTPVAGPLPAPLLTNSCCVVVAALAMPLQPATATASRGCGSDSPCPLQTPFLLDTPCPMMPLFLYDHPCFPLELPCCSLQCLHPRPSATPLPLPLLPCCVLSIFAAAEKWLIPHRRPVLFRALILVTATPCTAHWQHGIAQMQNRKGPGRTLTAQRNIRSVTH